MSNSTLDTTSGGHIDFYQLNYDVKNPLMITKSKMTTETLRTKLEATALDTSTKFCGEFRKTRRDLKNDSLEKWTPAPAKMDSDATPNTEEKM
jgi:hypothetical protein